MVGSRALFRRRRRNPGWRDPAARCLHPDRGHERRQQHEPGERVETVLEASGRVLDPTKNGPMKPPILPTEFISAMPAAAAVPVRKVEGSAQNGPLEP